MGNFLFNIFLDERISNLQEAILFCGVHGLLIEFDEWLYTNNLINQEAENVLRQNLSKDKEPTINTWNELQDKK